MLFFFLLVLKTKLCMRKSLFKIEVSKFFWHAAVHGVAKSQTQLSDWTTTELFCKGPLSKYIRFCGAQSLLQRIDSLCLQSVKATISQVETHRCHSVFSKTLLALKSEFLQPEHFQSSVKIIHSLRAVQKHFYHWSQFVILPLKIAQMR